MIEIIDMLLPQALPSEREVGAWISTDELVPAAFGALYETLTRQELRDELGEIKARIVQSATLRFTQGDQTDDAAHDAFFKIRRVEGNRAPALILSLLAARRLFLCDVEEGGVRISHLKLELIDQSLAELTFCLLGLDSSQAHRVTQWDGAQAPVAAMTRWVRGHQIFAALTQGLVFTFQSLGRATRAGNSRDVEKWADLSILLLRGSACAFEFTGDFPAEDYEKLIRRKMSPPESEVCLSGLMSVDHRFLVQTIRDVQPALRALSEREPGRHGALSAAMHQVYDSHIHVCERFVGNKASLLTDGRTEKSGPELVEHFKRLRLKPFEVARRALRPKTGFSPPTGTCPMTE